MKLKLYTLIIFFTGASWASVFGPPLEAIQYMPKTQSLINKDLGGGLLEPLELYSRIPGDPLDTSEKRSLRILDSPEILKNLYRISRRRLTLLYGRSMELSDVLVIANYKYRSPIAGAPIHWVAIIPKKANVTDLILQLEWFVEGGAGAHLQVRVKLDEDIILLPQNFRSISGDWDKEPMRRRGDFVYSLSAIRSKNGAQEWSPGPGLFGDYANAYKVVDIDTIAEEQTNSNFVEQYRLDLKSLGSDGQKIKNRMLFDGIAHSSRVKESTIYNTVYNSCITAALEFLNNTGLGLDISTQIFNPYMIVGHFEKKGYINENSKMMSLNEEYGSSQLSFRTEENKSVYDKVDRLMPLIQSEGFDKMARQTTGYLLKNRWTYPEFSQLIQVIKSVDPKAASISDQFLSQLEASSLSAERKLESRLIFENILARLAESGQKFDPDILLLISEFQIR